MVTGLFFLIMVLIIIRIIAIIIIIIIIIRIRRIITIIIVIGYWATKVRVAFSLGFILEEPGNDGCGNPEAFKQRSLGAE